MKEDKSQLTPMKLRERVGLTQRQVSVALDKRQGTISDWERGITSPRLTLKEVKELMHLYDCTLDELVEAFELVRPSEHPQQTK
jgi:transcriptional regulator with XRE-family HTH domain